MPITSSIPNCNSNCTGNICLVGICWEELIEFKPSTGEYKFGNCQCSNLPNGPSIPGSGAWRKKKGNALSTDEMYKSALLQSRQAANFVNPTNANFCYAKDMSTGSTKNICIAGGNQCPGCSLNNCCYKNTVLNECGCFASNPGTGWIRQSVKSPDYKMEASLRIARENFSTPTNPTSQ